MFELTFTLFNQYSPISSNLFGMGGSTERGYTMRRKTLKYNMKSLVIILATLFLMFGIPIPASAAMYHLENFFDDATAVKSGVLYNANWVSWSTVQFGNELAYGAKFTKDAYLRYSVNIPKGSTIIDAHLCFMAAFTTTPVFDTIIFGLSLADNPAWRNTDPEDDSASGFGTKNYPKAHCGYPLIGLNQIPLIGTFVSWESVPSWYGTVPPNTYYSPDIKDIVQDLIDSPDYDPSDPVGNKIGFRVYTGTGTPGSYSGRYFYSYEGPYDLAPAYAATLSITYTAP